MTPALESLYAATMASLGSDALMAILQAYFDESGKLQDKAQHVVFGAVCGRMDELSVFDRKWRSVLGSSVDHIHMKEAMRLEGAFKGWIERDRDELLIECAKVARAESALLVVSEMDKRDFNSLSQEQRHRLKNPTYGGFETCIRVLARQFFAHDIHIWYDESEEYATTCLKLYQRLKSMHTNFARRLPSLTFANDEKYPGLQAADMLAYAAYVVQREKGEAHRTVREVNGILRTQGDQQPIHVVYTKGAVLGSGILEA